MKRIIALMLSLLILAVVTLGCGTPAAQDEARGERLSIVSTIFPQYDWVREILGDAADDFDLTLVINNRIDMHSFQPSVSDMVRISTADLLIYVGGHSDGWVTDALAQAANPDMIVINLMDLLGPDAQIEHPHHHHHHDCDDEDCEYDHHGHHHHGHHHGHHHHHDDDCDDEDCDHEHHGHHHGHHHHHDDDCDDEDCDHEHHGHHHGHHHHHHHDDCDHHHHHGEADEHVWLSLRNAQIFTTAIADALTTLSPSHAEVIAENVTAYNARLHALDLEYIAVVNAAATNTLLFADRFPFRYMVEDYNLNYYAAFPGCHAETEASFSTIIFLAGRVDYLGLHSVVVTESANPAIANTIIDNSGSNADNVLVLVMDSMQSSNSADRAAGITYYSIMRGNLTVLAAALG